MIIIFRCFTLMYKYIIIKIVSSFCQRRLLNPQHWTFKYHQAATLVHKEKAITFSRGRSITVTALPKRCLSESTFVKVCSSLGDINERLENDLKAFLFG